MDYNLSRKKSVRARYKLSLRQLSDKTFIVSGGESDHLVIDNRDIDQGFSCDCRSGVENHNCSHVFRVLMRVDEDIKQKTLFILSVYHKELISRAQRMDKCRRFSDAKATRFQAFQIELKMKRI